MNASSYHYRIVPAHGKFANAGMAGTGDRDRRASIEASEWNGFQ